MKEQHFGKFFGRSAKGWSSRAEKQVDRARASQRRKDFQMLFMIIERFKENDMLPIYKRVRDEGRMVPAGLTYLDSWIEPNFSRCFQLMECDDLQLFQEWTLKWRGS